MDEQVTSGARPSSSVGAPASGRDRAEAGPDAENNKTTVASDDLDELAIWVATRPIDVD